MIINDSAALGDLRVLEVTDESGQLCGKLLADMGADVIKVEPPGGSAERAVGPFYKDEVHSDRSLFFWHYNTSKRGITLNLDSSEGQQIFHALAKTADIVIESNSPGYMACRGLGYDEIKNINPRIVYCSITPYGQDGPQCQNQASELTLMAAGGQMGVCGYSPEDSPDELPVAPGGGNAWHIGCHNAYIAIMAAVYARDMRGIGQYIDLSIQEAIAVCTEGAFGDHVYMGGDRLRQTGRHAGLQRSPPTQYLCKDGMYYNAFMARVAPDHWLQLVEVLESEGMAEDLTEPEYLDPEVLQSSMPHVMEVLGRFAATHTAEEMFHLGQTHNQAWTMVRAPSDLLADPHLRDRGFFVDLDHPELQESFIYPGAPYKFHGTPWRLSRRAPLLAEHNGDVYGQELGMNPETLDSLRSDGII